MIPNIWENKIDGNQTINQVLVLKITSCVVQSRSLNSYPVTGKSLTVIPSEKKPENTGRIFLYSIATLASLG